MLIMEIMLVLVFIEKMVSFTGHWKLLRGTPMPN